MIILNSPAALKTTLTFFWDVSDTVSAYIEIFTDVALLVDVMSFILLTSCMWDSLLMSEFVDGQRLTSIAASASLAIDDGLGAESNLWVGYISFSKPMEDIESVSKSRGGSL
jgi:hypothetical protein